jgi:hypothetical protein
VLVVAVLLMVPIQDLQDLLLQSVAVKVAFTTPLLQVMVALVAVLRVLAVHSEPRHLVKASKAVQHLLVAVTLLAVAVVREPLVAITLALQVVQVE